MKRVNHSFRREFKMPKLFVDDIEKIYDILNVVKPDSITIVDGEYEYQNPDDIKKDGRILHTFTINTREPFISLSLSKYAAYIDVSDDSDPIAVGLAAKISQVIEARERRLLYVMSRSDFYWFVIITANILYYAYLTLNIPSFETDLMLEVIVIVLILLYTYFIIQLRLHYYSTIVFAYASENKNIFQRNSDRLFVAAFSAIVGSLATIAVQSLLN